MPVRASFSERLTRGSSRRLGALMKTRHLAAQAALDTPLGPLRLAATAHGLAGAWFHGQAHHPGELDAPWDPEQPHLALAARELGGMAAADQPAAADSHHSAR